MERKLYEVKWKNTVVGTVYTNDKKEYKYIPEVNNIRDKAKEGMPSTLVIVPQREWKKTMPSFIERKLKINTKDRETVTDFFTVTEYDREH